MNNPDTSNKTKEFIKKHKKPLFIAGAAYLVLMFAVVIWAVSFVFSESDNDTSYQAPSENYSQTTTASDTENIPIPVEKEEATQSQKTRYAVSEDAAEQFCQDAGLLNGFIDSSKISTIYVTNYNKRYNDSFTYDKDGNSIKFFQWNGKYKSSGEPVGFSCWISGSSDTDITLHRLTIDGNTVLGETFESYGEDGSILN